MSVVYKTELIRHVAKRTKVNQQLISVVIHGLAAEIAADLQRGDTVQLTNFGTFYRRPRPAGRVRDFTTGAWREVPAGTVAAFRAGAVLKKAVGALPPARRGRPRLHRLFSRLGK